MIPQHLARSKCSLSVQSSDLTLRLCLSELIQSWPIAPNNDLAQNLVEKQHGLVPLMSNSRNVCECIVLKGMFNILWLAIILQKVITLA